MSEPIKWYDDKADNPPWIEALAEVRRLAPREGWCSGVYIFGGNTKRHWTANLVRWAVSFYMREWKWTLGALAAVVSVIFFRKL
jgi:hypothetical protein